MTNTFYKVITEVEMSLVKVKENFQITLPAAIRKKFKVAVGDYVEAVIQDGKIALIPKQLSNKAPIPSLNKKEQKVLAKTKEKITKIQTDMIKSTGLNDEEIAVAVKVGLIDSEQAWWWHETWQKGEREAERDFATGNYKEFNNIEDLIKDLRS